MAVTATLRAYVNSVVTGTTVRLRSAMSGDSNWGTALDGDQTEWDSTAAHIEDERAISSTGWKAFSLNPDNLSLGTGTTWFRHSDIYEHDGLTRNVIFRTEDYTGTGSDPYIEIVVTADSVNHFLASMGVGG